MIRKAGHKLGLWLVRKCGPAPRKLEIKISDESIARLRELAEAVAAGKTLVFKEFNNCVKFEPVTGG